MFSVFYYLIFVPVVCWTPFCESRKENLRDGVNYVSLDAAGNMTLYWSVNYIEEYVKFELHVIMRNYHWFAIGFSDYGEFAPADYCVMWNTYELETRLTDVWSNEFGQILPDEQQNCENFEFVFYKRVHAIFTFTRKFDTCDPEDYILQDGTTHIVWLRGNRPATEVKRFNVHDAKESGMLRVQLLKHGNIEKIGLPRNVKKIEFKVDKVRVPSADTTYWCHVIKSPEFLNEIHHIVQFEAIIQQGNEGLVHHMEIFHCEGPPDATISAYNGPCTDARRPKNTEICKKVMAAWAMGAAPFKYPKEAGLPIGGKGFNKYVMIEVHYNNPKLNPDYIDSSGIRLYATRTLRKYDAGVLELGLEYTDKMAIPPKQESFTLSGYCISECTAESIPFGGIYIFGSQLHTHLTGVQVITRHVREGRELPELNRDDHYSTHFQEIRLLKQPVLVMPGDALITTCRYNTLGRKNVTLGGFAISDEMCVNYVHYYPKIELEVCKSSISYQTLWTYFRYMNEWENQNTSLNYGISTNYQNIEWNRRRVENLRLLYEDMTLSMQCNSSFGNRFPGDWENIPLTRIAYSLPPALRKCKQEKMNL